MEAEIWMVKHKFQPIKHVDVTKNEYRYRIRQPDQFDHFATLEKMGKVPGTTQKAPFLLVIGFPPGHPRRKPLPRRKEAGLLL